VTRRGAGITLAIVHVALMGVLGLKLLADRAQLPRAWARTLPYDPSLPIRGRYVRLRLEVPLDSAPISTARWERIGVRLEAREERLHAVPDPNADLTVTIDSVAGGLRAALVKPVAFFIPEHVPDPSVRQAGEELWVEVTVPRQGPPRPIRIGVSTNGTIAPLDLR
jgi:hypothetical protein